MQDIKYLCDACGKTISEKRSGKNWTWFAKSRKGQYFESKQNNELCPVCERKLDKFLETLFTEGPIEWGKLK